ncbi:hypothetical protein K435DRAFT_959783 [Dendrothele bispora CBS 962.96]|uniref:BRCT domain-containing protein n=1 Tax=Dendrothele bispora (strain CBS 962.96) TaxID=1314807 RepID=A0A4S8MXA1_DENBC|nr:hypothetical protein K435DRAFT_959783 [Dendrothele bispora CBS 962.96]
MDPQIFCVSGTPITVFVEASEMVGRAKVVKHLKKHGADVRTSIQEAHFIVVDPETTAGRQIIRQWSNALDKIVLQHSWIMECVKVGRLLDARDKWGGWQAQDDGLPIAGEPGEEEQQNLPPLRRRSVENYRIAAHNATHHQATSFAQPISGAQDASTSRSASCPVVKNKRSVVATERSSSLAPSFSASTFAPPSLQAPSLVPAPSISPFHSHSTASASFNHSSTPMSASPLDQLPSSLPNACSQVPQIQAGMQVMSNPAQFFPFPFSANLPGMSFPQIPMMTLNPFFANPQLQQALTEQYRLMLQTGAIPNAMQGGQQPFPDAYIKQSPVSDTIHRSAQAGDHATSLVDVYNNRSPSTKGKERVKSPSSVGSRPTSDAALPIFVNSGGLPLRFFVQIDLRDRHRVVTTIKKHGGTITNKQDDADFAILSPKSSTYASLLKTSAAIHKPAIIPSFVENCVQQCALLDHTSYLLPVDDLAPVKEEKVKEKKVKEEKVQSEKKPKLKRKANFGSEPKARVKKAKHSTIVPNLLPYRSSPPPPPEHLRKYRDDGKYIYSTEELEFAVQYAEILLERDHNMPTYSIAKKLTEKMPHHTVRSWATTIGQKNVAVRDRIEKARSRAGVAYRKAYAKLQAQSSAQNDCDPQGILEEDMKVIVNFFLNDDDGNEDDNVVWAHLESKRSCRTKERWADFYKEHSVEVNKRLDELKR